MSHPHHHHKFDPAHLDKLRDPARAEYLNPELIWRLAAPPAARHVVDVGAGTGFFAVPFGRLAGAAGEVAALDIEPRMLEALRETLAQAGAANVKPLACQEAAWPLADGWADLVVMINLHHELAQPGETLAEAMRVLRPGGRVAVVDWKPEPTPMGPPVEHRARPEAALEDLRRAGFVEAQSHAGLPHHFFLTASRP